MKRLPNALIKEHGIHTTPLHTAEATARGEPGGCRRRNGHSPHGERTESVDWQPLHEAVWQHPPTRARQPVALHPPRHSPRLFLFPVAQANLRGTQPITVVLLLAGDWIRQEHVTSPWPMREEGKSAKGFLGMVFFTLKIGPK